MPAGFRSGSGSSGGGAGFRTPGGSGGQDSRRGFLKYLLGAAALTGVAALALNRDWDSAASPEVALTPEQIADYFIDVVLPREAGQRRKNPQMKPEDKVALRDAIIRYEKIELTAEDTITYYGATMNADERQFVKERTDYHLSRKVDPGLAGIHALQDLQVNGQIQRKEIHPMPSPDYTFEIYLRNRRFNDEFGMMSVPQAQEVAAGLEEDWQKIRERKTVIDFHTDTKDAHNRGLRSYWSSRAWTIDHAKKELKAGTFDQSVEEGRKRYSPPKPPAPGA